MTRAGSARFCQIALPAQTQAWWDKTARSVTCLTCHETHTADPTAPAVADGQQVAQPLTAISAEAPLLGEIDRGIGGASAQAKYDGLKARHDRRIEDRWGRGFVGGVAKTLSTEPQSTTAWAKGAVGEQALANRLGRDLPAPIVALHDRSVPGTKGNIDHLIIGPNGVWIVDAKNYKGKVERRDVGNWRTTDIQLFVNGRNRMKAVTGMEWQVAAVRAALAETPFAGAEIHPALCFTNSEWPLFAKPAQVKGVWVLWAKKLIELASAPGAHNDQAMDYIARVLSERLPAVTSEFASS